MTGRAAGYCAGYNVPGFMNPYGGRRFAGRPFGGFGRGRGYRNMYYATGLPGWQRYNPYPPAGATPGYAPDISPEEEMEGLKSQADMLKQQLNDIQARIDELTEEKGKEQ
jgi:hypothetical protein